MQIPQGPCCQSCAMPMNAPEDFGSNADGSKHEEYCIHCYQNGAFTWPDAKLADMIEFCAGIMAEKIAMSREEARAQLRQFLPRLKRWRGEASCS